MYILYVNNQKNRYNLVNVSDGQQELYHGRCGTISLKSEAEFFEVTVKNGVFEQKIHKGYHLITLLSLVLFGFFEHFLYQEREVLPYYFKIKLQKQLFMQLQFDSVEKKFKSNVPITQEKVKDKHYRIFWIFGYIIPLQIGIVICVLLAIIFYKITILLMIFGLIALLNQVILIFNIFQDMK